MNLPLFPLFRKLKNKIKIILKFLQWNLLETEHPFAEMANNAGDDTVCIKLYSQQSKC